ncbi:MAG: glycosyltransferase family 4 protein [Acidobacteria bacterium]|nr:glycosyltransferase family 4 protein [Acidobacteriota bacterium]
MRDLRVVVVARSVFPLHPVGGLERSVYDLVRHIAEAGVKVTLITRDVTNPDVDSSPRNVHSRIDLRMVPYRTFPLAGRRGTTVLDRITAYPLFGMRAGYAAWQLVRDGHADIVHGFGASVLGYARRRDLSKAPLVLNPQGLEEFGATDPSRARLKRIAYLPLRQAVLTCARAADRIIATDRVLEPAVRQHLGVPADRIRVIPNAIDLAWLDTLAGRSDGGRVRRAAGIEDDEVVLLSVGRIEQNKGLDVLAAALGALRLHAGRIADGRWRWVIIGEGPFRTRLDEAIRAASIAPHVVFAGRVADPDLHAWYEVATLFVHPTLYEGSSLVTLEAMAHRRAVVATRAGGLPDKVKPGVTGWLVPPGDAAGLAAAISGALGEPRCLPAMGEAGRALVEREFSWASAGAATLRLYEELV